MRCISLAVLINLAAILAIWGCATLPTGFERPVTYALSDTQNSNLGQYVSAKAKPFPGKSGFHLLGNGLDAFTARAVLADSAQFSIDAQYYLYHHDLVGQLFTAFLVRAADRGAGALAGG